MAKKKKVAKKAVPKAKRSPRKATRKPARPRKPATRNRKPASRKVAKKPAPKKAVLGKPPTQKAAPARGASKKSSSRRGLPARESYPPERAAATRVEPGPSDRRRSAFSPEGEVYGEEGWKEEELSAAELDADVPESDELEAEPDEPEIAGESDDSEW
ncbi:MAG: hypothetical protein ABI968_04315 [Acidobacteriota bacterium]